MASGTLPAAQVVRVNAPGGRRTRLRDIWTTLPIVRVLAVRDFKTRYKQSALGPIWLLIEPLGVLAAFTVIFDGVSQVDTHGIPYPLFAIVGITVWSFLQPALSHGSRCHTSNKRLIDSVPCPRLAFVTATLVGSMPQLALTSTLTIVAVLVVQGGLPVQALLVPVCILWLLVLAYALVLALSSINVKYRDVSSVVPFLLQGALFLSPIGYPASEAPPNIQTFLQFNPLTGVIETWRWALLDSAVDPTSLVISLATTSAAVLVGWQIFRRAEPSFADVI